MAKDDAWDQHLDELNSKSYSRPLKVSLVRIEPPFVGRSSHTMHVHPYWQMALVFGRSFSVAVNEQRFTPEAGDVLLIPPQNWHLFDFSGGKQAWTIKFSLEDHDERFMPGIVAPGPEVRKLTEWLNAIIQMEADASRERMVIIEHLLAALLDLHFNACGIDSRCLELLRRIRRFVDGQIILGRQVLAAEVAEHMRLSQSYLKQVLKKNMGIPLKVFIDQRRFEAVREFLTHSDLNASQIAAQLGFADVFRMSRFFKRMSGLPPSAYRKRFVTPAG